MYITFIYFFSHKKHRGFNYKVKTIIINYSLFYKSWLIITKITVIKYDFNAKKNKMDGSELKD